MKIKILLYPAYVEVESLQNTSPVLYRFLKENGVELEGVEWNGRLDTLPPRGEHMLVRASSKLPYGTWWDQLGSRCLQLGHLCFYDDQFVSMDGLESQRGSKCLIEEAAKFLERATVKV